MVYSDLDNINSENYSGNRYIHYAPPTSAADQLDLLYAYTEQGKPDFGKTASINFRHAMSMVVFKVANNLGHAQVKVDAIRLYNLAYSGNMLFPEKPTDVNVEDHTANGAYPETETVCKWTDIIHGTDKHDDGATRIFRYNLQNTVVLNDGELKNLTDVDLRDNKETNYNGVFLLIPETYPAWDPTKAEFPRGQKDGAFMLLKCSIQNIADKNSATPSEEDVFIWSDNGKTKELAIPLPVDWKPGKKYIYTIKFNGKGNGGYDPETGDKVLVPIEFTVTVDDFAESTDEIVNL